MAIVKSVLDKSISLNVQHDYITLRTPNGNFTISFKGSKASGNLVKDNKAFNALDKFVTNSKSYGDAMNLLLDPNTLSKYWKNWNDVVKKNNFKVGDVVKFNNPILSKKYPNSYTVTKSARKYVYINVIEKGKNINIGFDFNELI